METLKVDLREIMTRNMWVLSFFGLLPYKSTSILQFILHLMVIGIFTGILYGGLIIAQLVKMIISFRIGIVEVVSASYITLTNAFSFIKILLVYWHRKRILAMFASLNREEFRPKNNYQANILKDYVNTSKTVTSLLLFVSSLVCCFWCVYPLTAENGPFLPLIAYFPYNTDDPTVFALTYAAEFLGILTSAWCCLSTDTLIGALIMVISAQLSLLNDTLKNLYKYSINERNICAQGNKVEDIETIMDRNLIKCVHHHRLILNFARDVETISRISTIGQFSLTVLILCTAFFQLASLKKLNLECLTIILYILVIANENFIFCYFGNEALVKHNELTYSAYSCEWNVMSTNFRKKLIFFMTRSQKPLRLLAGGYIPLSLGTFVMIIKTSISYFTVLNQISNGS